MKCKICKKRRVDAMFKNETFEDFVKSTNFSCEFFFVEKTNNKHQYVVIASRGNRKSVFNFFTINDTTPDPNAEELLAFIQSEYQIVNEPLIDLLSCELSSLDIFSCMQTARSAANLFTDAEISHLMNCDWE